VKTGGAWQAIEWNMRRNAERHEDSAKSFVEADPERNSYCDVVGVEMR
jgi:hypothetical protein